MRSVYKKKKKISCALGLHACARAPTPNSNTRKTYSNSSKLVCYADLIAYRTDHAPPHVVIVQTLNYAINNVITA